MTDLHLVDGIDPATVGDDPPPPAPSGLVFSRKVDGNRIVIRCGALAIGAVYPPLNVNVAHWGWWAWITARIEPVSGDSLSLDQAEDEIISQFRIMLRLSGLLSAEAMP